MNEIEVVYRYENGTEVVRYRRPYPSESAEKMIEQVHERQRHGRDNGYESPYFWRYSDSGIQQNTEDATGTTWI